MTELQKFLIF